MGQKEGMEREQVIAYTEGRESALRKEQKTAYLGLGCDGWGTSAMRSLKIPA
jgi:hypothetical protein